MNGECTAGLFPGYRCFTLARRSSMNGECTAGLFPGYRPGEAQ